MRDHLNVCLAGQVRPLTYVVIALGRSMQMSFKVTATHYRLVEHKMYCADVNVQKA